jgi:hypothetical protein
MNNYFHPDRPDISNVVQQNNEWTMGEKMYFYRFDNGMFYTSVEHWLQHSSAPHLIEPQSIAFYVLRVYGLSKRALPTQEECYLCEFIWSTRAMFHLA